MTNDLATVLLGSVKDRFSSIKKLGEDAIAQLDDSDLAARRNEKCNSVILQIKHLSGSTSSMWTDPLTTDGRSGRDRDAEFVQTGTETRAELMNLWDGSWNCLLESLDRFAPADLLKEVTYGGRKFLLLRYILWQLEHSAYHVGQIVQTVKERRGDQWKTLSVPWAGSRDDDND